MVAILFLTKRSMESLQTENTPQNTQNPSVLSEFLSINHSEPTDSVFGDLSQELIQAEIANNGTGNNAQKNPKSPFGALEAVFVWSNRIMIVLVIVCFVTVFESNVRLADDAGIFKALPSFFCSYLSIGIDNYNNTDCKTATQILSDVQQKKTKLENDLLKDIITVVPPILATSDITSDPEVQFIAQHTGDTRIPITQVMNAFVQAKSNTPYHGADMDCSNYTFDEQGDVKTSCMVYGWSIADIGNNPDSTSRAKAVNFLNSFSATNSNFTLLHAPQFLDITSYFNTTGGIKSIFTSQTSLASLQLQYVSQSNILSH